MNHLAAALTTPDIASNAAGEDFGMIIPIGDEDLSDEGSAQVVTAFEVSGAVDGSGRHRAIK